MNLERSVRVLALLLVLASHACQRAPTSALVTVQSDLGDDLQSVFVQVRDAADNPGGETRSFTRAQYGDRFSFGIVPKNAQDREFVVVATALSCTDCEPETSPENVLVETKAIGAFVRETTIEITLALHAECRGVACEAGMTCAENTGTCVPLAQMQLPGGPPGPNTGGSSGTAAAGSGSANQPGQAGASGHAGTGGNAHQPDRGGTSGTSAGAAGREAQPGQAGANSQAGVGGSDPNQAGTGPAPAGTSASGQAGMSGSMAPPGKSLGDPCQSGSDCLSTFCADGVCCQSACGESCKACNLPDHVGVCTDVGAGDKPAAGHAACTAEAQASCGKTGACDGAGQCALWTDIVCKPASCDAGNNSVSAAAKCDGEGTCVAPSAISCAPYTCDASGVACNTGCSASQPCAAPNPCVAGSCGAKPNGSPCSANADCTSSACVDGLCCDRACDGQCEACDLAANPGTCSPVTSGQPHGGRAACAGASSCAGACKAASRTSCTFPNASCRPPSCQGSKLTAAAACDGAGQCPALSTSNCPGNLVCNSGGTACLTSCSGNADCTSAAPYCSSGACTNQAPNGSACSANSACQSTHCVDGLCCNDACSGQCEACDVSGAPGVCSAVTSGTPHGSRAACGGAAPCDGACGAGSRTACTYPGASVMCAAAGCADATTVSNAQFCNGAGACGPPTTMPCASGQMCASATCAATCFAAGTPVDTETGLRPIESIRPGERVRTFDELTGKLSYRKVTQLERRVAHSLVRMTFNTGSSISVSPEHQFWVQDTGWVRAGLLTLDDQLQLAEAGALSIEALEMLPASELAADGGVEVFNLLVEASPTYFVGELPVLVHSCDYLNFSALDPLDTPQ